MSDMVTQVQQMVAEHLNNVKQGIAANMAAHHRMASGRSVASLVVEPSQRGMALYGGAQWATMQRGRAAGKVPMNFREIIKDWIKAKGIAISGGEKGLNSAAFLISRSIMKKGTTLHQHHGYDDIFDSLIEKEFEKVNADATNIVGMAVDKLNDKFVKS